VESEYVQTPISCKGVQSGYVRTDLNMSGSVKSRHVLAVSDFSKEQTHKIQSSLSYHEYVHVLFVRLLSKPEVSVLAGFVSNG
jgi:hypothetical protein